MNHKPLNPSRDPRVEDPTNLWLFDPSAQVLVPLAVRLGISANAISIAGLFFGAGSAVAYARWQQPRWAALGLLISMVWLVMDSLDGMVARATGTSSAFGRELDGWCDHGVFAMIYIALAISVGGGADWTLMIAAAIAHAIQASLYEAERERFNRRLSGRYAEPESRPSRNPATRLYDRIASSLDNVSAPFDRFFAGASGQNALRQHYDRAAVPVLRLMLPLSQNMRLAALFLACAAGRMTMFLWYELLPLSALTAIGVVMHRHIEARLLRAA